MIASKPHRLAKVFIAIVLASTLVGSLCAQSPPTPAASGLLKPPELPTRLPWYTPPSPVLNLPAAPRDAALPPAPATAVAPAPAQPERPPSSTQPSPEIASSEPAVSGSLRTFENPHLTSTAQAGAAPQVVPQPVIVQSQIATENSAALPNPGGLPVDAAAQPSGAVNLALPIKPLTEPYWVSTLQSLSTSGQADLQPLVFDQAIWDALSFSPYVKGVMTVPLVSQAKISEATGIFDPLPFVDSIFDNSSDPAGTTLVTGGPLRLNETRYDNGVGIKSKNVRGGTAELSQNVLMRNNNSVFLAPKNQADSKLVLRLNQPLMKGAGQAYTTSSIRIAEFNAGVSQQEATRKLQLHAQSIAQAYWNLYSARVIEMQAERGKLRLTFLRDELSKRAEVDGLKSQMLRAEAAIARQQANIARAKAETASAQAALRALVNSPQLAGGPTAVVPATPPIDQPFVIDRTQELQTALAFHPELLATRDRIKAATTRLNVAENELRPTLNLVMEGYLHSLSGDYAIADSMVNQFTGRPSYGGGLNYERPYRNVVAKAILRERRLELRQLLLDLDNTMLNITAEVDQAIAAITATYTELEASEKATLAFDAEVRYLEGRWQNAFVESMSPSLLLDELLNAENQLIQAENAWARAQAEHMIAFVNLHVATGMLLNAVPLPPQSE